jgi:hypothetical protein
MALLYPWATKEYILWDMSLGQVMMYLAIGNEQKYGKQKEAPAEKLSDKSYDELVEIREQMIRDGLIERYGDIG